MPVHFQFKFCVSGTASEKPRCAAIDNPTRETDYAEICGRTGSHGAALGGRNGGLGCCDPAERGQAAGADGVAVGAAEDGGEEAASSRCQDEQAASPDCQDAQAA